MVTLTVYRAVVHNARAMACFVSARRSVRALCCAGAALLLGVGCASDVNREQLAAEYFNLGTGYLELGEPQQAAGYFRRGLELQPEADDTRFNLAVALLELGDAAAAAGHLGVLLAADPENVRVLELLAESHERRGRLGDALSTYRRVLQVQPEHGMARYNVAILLWALGELPDAAKELRTLLRLDPDDHQARSRLGALLAQTGPPEEAATVLGEYLEAVPDDADALTTLAEVERRRGRYEAALAAYGAASALLPAGAARQPELAFERAAILLAELEDHGAGLAALTLALENGYRDLDRLTELLLEERLVRRGAVLELVTEYFPELLVAPGASPAQVPPAAPPPGG